MADQAKEELINALSKLWTSAEYSDLTVQCGPDEYKIHRAIVCPRSDYFARECRVRDTRSPIIVTGVSRHAFRVMMDYLYHLEYHAATEFTEADDFVEEKSALSVPSQEREYSTLMAVEDAPSGPSPCSDGETQLAHPAGEPSTEATMSASGGKPIEQTSSHNQSKEAKEELDDWEWGTWGSATKLGTFTSEPVGEIPNAMEAVAEPTAFVSEAITGAAEVSHTTANDEWSFSSLKPKKKKKKTPKAWEDLDTKIEKLNDVVESKECTLEQQSQQQVQEPAVNEPTPAVISTTEPVPVGEVDSASTLQHAESTNPAVDDVWGFGLGSTKTTKKKKKPKKASFCWDEDTALVEPPAEEVVAPEVAIPELTETATAAPEPIVTDPWVAGWPVTAKSKKKSASATWDDAVAAVEQVTEEPSIEETLAAEPAAEDGWGSWGGILKKKKKKPTRSAIDAPATGPPNLLVDAKIYSVAEKFSIHGLKALALEKFKANAAVYWDDADFLKAIAEVYRTAKEGDMSLKDVIVGVLHQRKALLNKPGVQELLKEGYPTLAYDLLMYAHKESAWW